MINAQRQTKGRRGRRWLTFALAASLLANLALAIVPVGEAQALIQTGGWSRASGSNSTFYIIPLRQVSPTRWTSAPSLTPITGGSGQGRVIIIRRPVPTPTTPGSPAPAPAPAPAPQPQPQPQPQPVPQPPAGDTAADEQRMLDLINRERAAAGVPPLALDPRLADTARRKSQDMVNRGYFGHTSPTYGQPWDMWKQAGIPFRMGGENLAGAPTVEIAHQNLMNSPGHRANILNPTYTHVGIGVVAGGPYGKMFTQHFVQQ